MQGESEIWIVLLSPVQRNCQSKSRGPPVRAGRRETDSWRIPRVKYSVVYRVCRGRRGWWIIRWWLLVRKKMPSDPHVHQSQLYTPATMKRVADSQLTKDTEGGDDGPEVNGLCSTRCCPNSPRLVLTGCWGWIQEGLRFRTREQEVCTFLPNKVPFLTKPLHFILG